MKVPQYDGEPVTHVDHNLQRELILRKIFAEISMNLAGPSQVPWDLTTFGRRTEELRPLRHAGAIFSNSGTSVDINGGLWIQADYAGPLTADAATALVGHKDAIEEITGFAAAAAGTFRRDIIQARLTAVDDAAVARDYEDAVTREVTTTGVVWATEKMVKADLVECGRRGKTGDVPAEFTTPLAVPQHGDHRVPANQ